MNFQRLGRSDLRSVSLYVGSWVGLVVHVIVIKFRLSWKLRKDVHYAFKLVLVGKWCGVAVMPQSPRCRALRTRSVIMEHSRTGILVG